MKPIVNSTYKIAIASGKGGTGKTFVSTNLFHALSQGNHTIHLVDCDAEEPNAKMFIEGDLVDSFNITQEVPVIDTDQCTYCGKCAEYCHYNAIICIENPQYIEVMDELCHGCGACFVACSYDAITPKEVVLGKVSTYDVGANRKLVEARMEIGVHSPVPIIKAAIKHADKAEIVLMDAPPGTSCPFIQTVNLADYVVLVTEPTPFGLNDLKQSVETLQSIGKNCGVIVNKAGLGSQEVYAYLEQENIPLLMDIPFDRDIAAEYAGGGLLVANNTQWQEQFQALFESIVEQYGNSNH